MNIERTTQVGRLHARELREEMAGIKAQRDALAASLRAVLSDYPALLASHRQRAPGSYTLADAVIANARAALAQVPE